MVITDFVILHKNERVIENSGGNSRYGLSRFCSFKFCYYMIYNNSFRTLHNVLLEGR